MLLGFKWDPNAKVWSLLFSEDNDEDEEKQGGVDEEEKWKLKLKNAVELACSSKGLNLTYFSRVTKAK